MDRRGVGRQVKFRSQLQKNELWRYTVQHMDQTCRTWATAFRAVDYYILTTQVHVHISEGTRHGFSVPVVAWKSSHRRFTCIAEQMTIEGNNLLISLTVNRRSAVM